MTAAIATVIGKFAFCLAIEGVDADLAVLVPNRDNRSSCTFGNGDAGNRGSSFLQHFPERAFLSGPDRHVTRVITRHKYRLIRLASKAVTRPEWPGS